MTRLLNGAISTEVRKLPPTERDRIASIVFALPEGPYELGMER